MKEEQTRLHIHERSLNCRHEFDSSEMHNTRKARTHKSAKTHAGNVFVTRDVDL